MLQDVTSRRGSAVLISLLIMAVLVLMSIGLNALILKEIMVQSNVVNGLTAYYGAESGLERGLLDVYKANTPGFTKPYEPQKLLTDQNAAFVHGTLVEKSRTTPLKYQYNILGQDSSAPCDFIDHENVADMPYGQLGINESVTLPLYAYNPSDKTGKSKTSDFVVDYFVDGAGITDIITNLLADKIDILRWKILGLSDESNRLIYGEETDAITDYVSLIQNRNADKTPSQFASNKTLLWNQSWDVLTKGKHLDRRRPNDYNPYPQKYVRPLNDKYEISTFLDKHVFNYLLLTNVLSDNLVFTGGKWVSKNDSNYKKLLANRILNYRVRTKEGGLISCNNYIIRSDGLYRDAKQSIDMKISHDTFLPVFDFAVYRTKVGE